jgi:hypothetical protein
VRAKVRCSFDPAGCSRCISRGNPCTYPGRLSHNPDFGNPTLAASGNSFSQDKAPETNGSPPVNNPTLSLDEIGLGVAAPFIDTISGNNQIPHSASTWDNEASWTGFPDVLDLLTPPDGEYHLGVYTEASTVSDETQRVPDHTTGSRHLRQPSPSIPVSLSYKDPSSMFERRNFSQMELEVTGDIALHILRSYLYVMADGDSPPPFIHPKYRDLIPIGTGRPNPLSAAMKLAKMLVLGRGMNKTLIWRLIRMEQERLLNDVRAATLRSAYPVANQRHYRKHLKFDRWESLEALQSLVLYILMRINEGRRDYTNFDTQLLISVNVSSHNSNPHPIFQKHAYSREERNKGTLSSYLDKLWHACKL